MSKVVPLSRAYRLAVASRVLAAAFGGYALASAATVLLALVWPGDSRPEALLWASMLSFTLYSVAAIWVFAARSATRAWVGIVAVTAACAALAWLLHSGGAA